MTDAVPHPATPRPSGTHPTTPRPDVALRPARAEDADWLWTWMHGTPDAEWKRWDAPYFHAADNTTPPSRADFDADHLARRVGTPDVRVVTADGAAVGLVTRTEQHPAGSGWWELGILLFDPATWGRGLGGSALRLWTAATFEETGAHVLSLVTWSGNARMIASARRVGYREVARIPEARQWDGRRWDSVQLAMLRTDQHDDGAQPDDDAPRETAVVAGVTYTSDALPDVAELIELYDAVEWTAYTRDPDALAAGVAGSAHVVTARVGGRLVGLARVVSDGHTIAYLQDVLVDPAHHRRSIGTELLNRAFAPFACAREHVLLTDAEPGQRAFYESAGFTETRDLPHGEARAFVRFTG